MANRVSALGYINSPSTIFQSIIAMDIDFSRIVPRFGGKSEAFEEMCCQLARRVMGDGLRRVDGSGGDGGVECYFDTPDGRFGWQAKYVFKVDNLISQASGSLGEALNIHPELTRYYLCFPFDLTGPTGRRGRSGIEKFEEWKIEWESRPRTNGNSLTIEVWSASEILSLLLEHDASGGLRRFFFDKVLLSDHWFEEHVQRAIATAGPRYTPDPNVETDLGKWLAAFGREPSWAEAFEPQIARLRGAEKRLGYSLHEPRDDQGRDPVWPDDTLKATEELVAHVRQTLDAVSEPYSLTNDQYRRAVGDLREVFKRLKKIEGFLSRDIEDRHGEGRADSVPWRQWMAEYMVSFPAAHLDSVRNLSTVIDKFVSWLESPQCALAFEQVFVLDGEPSTGKTHGVCDAGQVRLSDGLRTCIVFGHEFGDQPEPWSRVGGSMGLSASLGSDELLDCLNAAGEASGLPLVLFIDAINETKPLGYWKNQIASMAQRVRVREYLRLCVVCKTSYLNHCLPDERDFPVATHRGFVGIEREACQAYFSHFGLRPPIAPILQPELANPLYLRLVCETLQAEGLDRLPPGWSGGGTRIIKDFLNQKASQFSDHFQGARLGTSTNCIMRIVKAIAKSGVAALPWPDARALIESEASDPDGVLTWLVREGLLIEDVSDQAEFEPQSLVRPAFERLGDFLVAMEVLDSLRGEGISRASQPGGLLHAWLRDIASVEVNQGMLGEFSVLAAERYPGVELPNLASDQATFDDLVGITIRALVYRKPESISRATARIVRYAFGANELAYVAMDSVLACSWRESSMDALWVHNFLSRMAMHDRDPFWCGYLHRRYESDLIVTSLIGAVDELPLDNIEPEIAERWAVVLLWFTAAADRRIKDTATRAATAILLSVNSVIPRIVELFIDTNDDEVRERVLLSCYGAMLTSRNSGIVRSVAKYVYQRYLQSPSEFDNAVIRDHMRCICELLLELSPSSSEVKPEAITSQPASHDWSSEFARDEDIEKWADALHFKPDEFHNDFFKYSMGCLGRWTHEISKFDMGKWIAQRVALDFSFVGSRCEQYDNNMLYKYGGGRGKPVWAERIAKKYAWVALYQLASRLHDHVEAQYETWEPRSTKTPLILPEGRMLDPTILQARKKALTTEDGWPVPKPKDLAANEADFETWVRSDVGPTLQYIMKAISGGLRPTAAYLSWDGEEKQFESSRLYRKTWATLNGYLVSIDQFKSIYELLSERNLTGHSLPRGIHYLYGFAAEYPWGSVFTSADDEEDYSYGLSRELPEPLVPAWSEVVSEWEYDVTRENEAIYVPSRRLLSRSLRWDGKGGFADPDGNTRFSDPSYQSSKSACLLANAEYLNQTLNDKGLAMIFTLHGEKQLIARDYTQSADLPRRNFSQVAYLDGTSERFSNRVYFET